MKSALYTLYFSLLALVLFSKIANWFLNFSQATNDLINTAMFCLIGVGYIFLNHQSFNKVWPRVFTTICGVYLIIMNFIPKDTLLYILSIASVVCPLILAKIFKSKGQKNTEMADSISR